MSLSARAPVGNQILDLLSQDDWARFEPHLSQFLYQQNDMLYDVRAEIDYVYFPTTCVASALTIMVDGSAIEVATVGKEGLLGHTVMLGNTTSVNRVIVQIAGNALRMSASVLREAVVHSPELEELLKNYNRAYSFQVSQSVACNGLHQLEKRCCRWLLMTRDRVDSNEIPLTHEFLSYMLGVRRASVSDALAPLQAAGLLICKRGLITILDPEGLEDRACECYRTVNEEYGRILGTKTSHYSQSQSRN
jgi:CRP-like cAMP-binding protein